MNDIWISYNGKKPLSPQKIKGYEKLSEANQRIFTSFLKNYYERFEYPEDNQPTEVLAQENYLKVTFKDKWLHIINSDCWY